LKFPSSKELVTGLSSVLHRNKLAVGSVVLLDRKHNPYHSTFGSEIVTCRINGHNGAERIRFFVKYGAGRFDGVYGHRGNIAYEARVYRDVLQGLLMSTPRFYGAYKSGSDPGLWLILEYMSGGSPASWSKDPRIMVRSAGWIGKFHAMNEEKVKDGRVNFLHRYDANYYEGWSLRTKRLFHRVHAKFPWLAQLCGEFERRIPELTRAVPTIIHGEYFGSNIVNQGGLSRPIDWQSTAIGPGEVDLASLTHSWAARIVRNCEEEYARARWPDGAPHSFRDTLEVARMYMNLRWLGDPFLMEPLVTRLGRPKAKKSVFLAMQALVDLHSIGQRLALTDQGVG